MPDARELNRGDTELVDLARSLIDAHSDGLIHTVGAAVRDREGRTYGGVNLFHFTGGPCAELVALAAARAGGARQLDTIVAVGDQGRGVIGPCGRDRQVLSDYHPEIRVILPTAEGLRSVLVGSLLPWAMAGPLED